jgi:hypothetical protein
MALLPTIGGRPTRMATTLQASIVGTQRARNISVRPPLGDAALCRLGAAGDGPPSIHFEVDLAISRLQPGSPWGSRGGSPSTLRGVAIHTARGHGEQDICASIGAVGGHRGALWSPPGAPYVAPVFRINKPITAAKSRLAARCEVSLSE